MAIVVARHELDPPEASARLVRKALDRFAALRTRTELLSSQLVGAVDGVCTAIAYAAVIGAIDDEVRAAVGLGGRAGAARFHAADRGAFTTTFGGPTASVPGDPVDASITVGRFRDSWSLATLAADDEALRWLVLFPALQLAGPVDGRQVRICQALQGLTEGRPVGPTLDEPPPPGPADPARIRPVTAATEEVLRALDQGPDAFDPALARFLEAHRTFYRSGEERGNIHGAVSLLGLALMAVAVRRGWPVAVTSPYLPLELVGVGYSAS